MGYIYPRGIETADDYVHSAYDDLKNSYDSIKDGINKLSKRISYLRSLNHSIYMDGNVKKELFVSVNDSNFNFFVSEINKSDMENGIIALSDKTIFDLDKVANDLEIYVNKIQKKISVDDVRDLLFSDTRSREDGLDEDLLKNSLSDETVKELKEKYGEDYDDKLRELIRKIDSFSKGHGCGTYALLAVINRKYSDGHNISKEEFFGEILIRSCFEGNNLSMNSSDGYKYDKFENLKTILDADNGPINTKFMGTVCDYLNENKKKYHIKNKIDYEVVAVVKNDKETKQRIFDCVSNGGAAVVMADKGDVKRKAVFEDEQELLNSESGITKAGHYVTIVKDVDSKGNALVVDTKNLKPKENESTIVKDMDVGNKEIDDDDWSGLYELNINDMPIKEKVKGDNERIGYNSQGGIILFN